MIYRDAITQLDQWKNLKERRPLLLRGARQVGKSTLVESWGGAVFSKLVTLNFEQSPEFKEAFETLDPHKIKQNLSLMTGHSFEEENTLLFLDEIQECPKAITALRYFYEQCPRLPIISAGSSLEMVLQAKNLKMPVGRIELLTLFPLNFGEYLQALGHKNLRDYLNQVSFKEKIPFPVHQKLLDLTKDYFLLGGMPAVIKGYLANQDVIRLKEIKNALLFTYRRDFGKYSDMVHPRYLEAVFRKAPQQVGRKVVYREIDDAVKPFELKKAIHLLTQVHLFHTIYRTSPSGLPLLAGINEKFFKLIFLDIGLLQRLSGLESQTMKLENLLDVYKGALAEQFVGQELLIALNNKREEPLLTYWAREAKNSSAEVDYLWVSQSKIIPIEVKAGKTGTLKSLYLFIKTYSSPFGIRVSTKPLSYEKNVLSIPLYLTSQIDRLCNEVKTHPWEPPPADVNGKAT